MSDAAVERKKLNDQIKEMLGSLSMPPEIREKLGQAVGELKAQGVAPGLTVGEKAPDFRLPNQEGKEVSLSDALSNGPVVVKFIRGEWCPICNLDVPALQSVLPRLKELGATILMINPQIAEKAKALETQHSVGFDILSDEKLQTARDYKIHFTLPQVGQEVYGMLGDQFNLPNQTADGSWDLPVPATFVVDREGVIRARHVEVDYTQRMEPDDIVEAVKNLG